jgi:phasin family protein
MLHCNNCAVHNLSTTQEIIDMYKPQETVEMMNELGTKGYNSLRQLGEMQMAAWNGLMEKQLQAFNVAVDSAVAQVQLVAEGKEPQELVQAQVELNRKLAEEMMAKTRESFELVQKAGEDVRGWAEEAVKQASAEAEKVSEKVAA